MDKRYHLLPISLFFISMFAYSNDEKISEGEYTYVYSGDVSRKRAEVIALERAREDAIQRAFGSIISSEGSLEMSDIGGDTSISFYKFGSSELLGEIISEEQPKYIHYPYNNDTRQSSVTCRVKCKVRSANRPRVQFDWHLLRNHIDKRSETTDFANEDALYMTFKAPCDGYLAVYLVDERGMAQCLIPHHDEPEGIYRILHDKEYVFFSEDNDNDDGMIPPHLLTTFTNHIKEEINQIYVFFSPNKFAKSTVNSPHQERGRFLPAEIDNDTFQRWQKHLLRDRELQREKKIISIKRSIE